MNLHEHKYTHALIYIRTHIHTTYIHVYNSHPPTGLHTYTYTYIHIIYIFTHAYTFPHTHTHLHIHIIHT